MVLNCCKLFNSKPTAIRVAAGALGVEDFGSCPWKSAGSNHKFFAFLRPGLWGFQVSA